MQYLVFSEHSSIAADSCLQLAAASWTLNSCSSWSETRCGAACPLGSSCRQASCCNRKRILFNGFWSVRSWSLMLCSPSPHVRAPCRPVAQQQAFFRSTSCCVRAAGVQGSLSDWMPGCYEAMLQMGLFRSSLLSGYVRLIYLERPKVWLNHQDPP